MGISSEKEPDWSDLLYFASLIPRVCHNINRICYVFGGPVEYPVNDVTQTNLTPNVIGTLRQVDFLANQVLHMANCAEKLSQMPLVSTQERERIKSNVRTLNFRSLSLSFPS